MTDAPTTNSNKPTFADTLAKVKDLGEQAGRGVDTQIKFFLAVTESAFLNVIDLDPDKHGKGIDESAEGGKAVHGS